MYSSKKILLLVTLIASIYAAVTINSITGVPTQNLVFSGQIPVGNNNLFFTYFGYDGETDQNNLKNHPLLIVVGKYFFVYTVLELQLSITVWEVLDPLTLTTI
jgi:hypothetical protein